MSSHSFWQFKNVCTKKGFVIQDEKFVGCLSNCVKFKIKCKEGHISDTTVSNPMCIICHEKNNPEKIINLLNQVDKFKIGASIIQPSYVREYYVILYLENGEMKQNVKLNSEYVVKMFEILALKNITDCLEGRDRVQCNLSTDLDEMIKQGENIYNIDRIGSLLNRIKSLPNDNDIIISYNPPLKRIKFYKMINKMLYYFPVWREKKKAD